jgi:hypothetical protein
MQRLAKHLESKVYISAMIQPVPKSKKERKSISRQVNLAISSPPATTEYLRWSEQPVKFSRADHPRKVPRPGHSPMVLKAQIGGYDIGRVFMDAGSGINLIYAKTLKAMCISLTSLKPTDCSFHGIVPGAANYPLGRIELDVCFGSSENYRREKLEFEVMDWPSQYHAILGRPAFAKFMAVPHYAYVFSRRHLRKAMALTGDGEGRRRCDIGTSDQSLGYLFYPKKERKGQVESDEETI